MATTYSVLGQSNPSATTSTTLYTCPASTQTVISSLVVCNQGSSGTYRIAVRINAATLTTSQFLVFDATLGANSTVAYTLGITCDASDLVVVYASSANFSFTAFGSEIA